MKNKEEREGRVRREMMENMIKILGPSVEKYTRSDGRWSEDAGGDGTEGWRGLRQWEKM